MTGFGGAAEMAVIVQRHEVTQMTNGRQIDHRPFRSLLTKLLVGPIATSAVFALNLMRSTLNFHRGLSNTVPLLKDGVCDASNITSAAGNVRFRGHLGLAIQAE